jgi:hypothetical protein
MYIRKQQIQIRMNRIDANRETLRSDEFTNSFIK